jgi:hypothetical protein
MGFSFTYSQLTFFHERGFGSSDTIHGSAVMSKSQIIGISIIRICGCFKHCHGLFRSDRQPRDEG